MLYLSEMKRIRAPAARLLSRAGGDLGSMVPGISTTQPRRQHHPATHDVERFGWLVRQHGARWVPGHADCEGVFPVNAYDTFTSCSNTLTRPFA